MVQQYPQQAGLLTLRSMLCFVFPDYTSDILKQNSHITATSSCRTYTCFPFHQIKSNDLFDTYRVLIYFDLCIISHTSIINQHSSESWYIKSSCKHFTFAHENIICIKSAFLHRFKIRLTFCYYYIC